MPLLVDAVLKSSPIHGLGMFARSAIAAGTPVWRFDSRIDRILVPDEELRASYPVVDRLLEEHACDVEGGLLMFGDDTRFVNHSDAPNVVPAVAGDFRAFRAARDIAAGEELTCNYEAICDSVRSVGADAYLSAAT